MKKKILQGVCAVVVLAAIAVFAAAPIRNAKTDASDWMAQLDDERIIRTLSIPGTHDSGALYSIFDAFGKCQSLPISEQLTIGVRFLDIRLRLVDDELLVVHNFVDQKMNFRELLPQLTQFLQENPSEFLIVSIKEEASALHSDGTFSKALENMLGEYPDIVSSADQLPEQVGEARGKLYLLSRYPDNAMGIPCADHWQDNTSFELQNLYVQDHYRLQATSEKLPDILHTFDVADSGQYALVLNYSSCYISPSFPPAYAGITAGRINPWLKTNLAETEGHVGVLICDFITSDLAQRIIGRNFE